MDSSESTSSENVETDLETTNLSYSDDDNSEDSNVRYISKRTSTRRTKRDSALKDQQSTGRKRAARLYPLNRELPCEWRGKANCGGGPYPIIGCLSGLQTDRHHGPDKNVTNNEEGNVHRICSFCHHRWHAENNADYDWNSTLVKSHNPRPATDEEKQQIALIEMIYRSKKQVKIRD